MGFFVDDHVEARWPHGRPFEDEPEWCPRRKQEQVRAKWIWDVLHEHPTQGLLGILPDGRPQVYSASHDEGGIATLDLDDKRASGLFHAHCGSDLCRHIQLYWAAVPEGKLIRVRQGQRGNKQTVPNGRRKVDATVPPAEQAVPAANELTAPVATSAAASPPPMLDAVAVRLVAPPQPMPPEPARPPVPPEPEPSTPAADDVPPVGTRKQPAKRVRGKRAPVTTLRQMVVMPANAMAVSFRRPDGAAMDLNRVTDFDGVCAKAKELGYTPAGSAQPAQPTAPSADFLLQATAVATALRLLGIMNGAVNRQDLERQLDPDLHTRPEEYVKKFRNRLGNVVKSAEVARQLKGKVESKRLGRNGLYTLVSA